MPEPDAARSRSSRRAGLYRLGGLGLGCHPRDLAVPPGRARHGNVERRPIRRTHRPGAAIRARDFARQGCPANPEHYGPCRAAAAGTSPSNADWAAHRALAREIAIGGTVLLRNSGGILPLTRDDLPSLVLIGPVARIPLTGGGGSSHVAAPDGTRSLWQALRARAGAQGPAYAVGIERDGVPVPAAALEPTGDSAPTIDLAVPASSEWQWSGGLKAPRSGRYALALQADPVGEDPAAPWQAGGSARLRLDGTEVVALGGSFGGDASLLRTADGLANATAEVDLRAGRSHAIAVKARAGPNGPMRLRLAWITPDAEEQARAAAVAAARSARTAIVVAWDEAGEGHDRPALDLPWRQDRLIAAVAGANPR